MPSSAPRKVCIIIGSALGCQDEASAASHILERLGYVYDVFAINAVVGSYPYPISHAVSLHPDKLQKWLKEREKAGFDGPKEIWTHRSRGGGWHRTDDWGGSSGLLAVKVALETGYTHRILCGVPMTKTPHFNSVQPWPYAGQFMGAWRQHFDKYATGTRSMSGWTAELLGKPEPSWLS